MSNIVTELKRLLGVDPSLVSTGIVKTIVSGVMYVDINGNISAYPAESNISLGDAVAIVGGAVIGIIGGGVDFGECHP